ncbi:MAG: hypothetical protein H3C47_06490 [Candidatus Cloacimonetes bacterium]|nr:hypothetical protein [Candidatus Cloacimonadota bacterium]
MLNPIRKIAGIAVCALLLAGPVQANELQRMAIFESLYSRDDIQAGDTQVVEEAAPEEAASEGAENAEASEPKVTVRQLIEQIASLSDAEKFAQVTAWIQSGNPQANTIENLVGALRMLQMETALVDKIVGVYAGKQADKITENSLNVVLSLLSEESYANPSESENWAVMAISNYVNHRSVTYDDFYSMMKSFARSGGNQDLRDQKLMHEFVVAQGSKLELNQVSRLIDLMENRNLKAQAAGMVLNSYMLSNAGDLLKPEFRETLAKMQSYWPLGAGLLKLDSLSATQQPVLLEVEWNFFRNIFYTTGTVVNTIKSSLAPEEWRAVRDLFVQRNQHRLKASQIQKLNNAF